MFTKKSNASVCLQTKLAEKLQTDETLRAKVKTVAESVLKDLKAGADFGQVAAKYGEDGTAQVAGSLGWFQAGEMVPAF